MGQWKEPANEAPISRCYDLVTYLDRPVGWLDTFCHFPDGYPVFFQDEISSWMQPELKTAATQIQAIAQAEQFLQQKAPDSERWSITLPNSRAQTTELFWRTEGQNGRRFERATLDGSGQAVALRDTRGGSFYTDSILTCITCR